MPSKILNICRLALMAGITFPFATSLVAQTVEPAGVRTMGSVNASYQISADDVLEISVFQESDLRSVVRVSRDGTVMLPLIKVIALKGLTSQEAAQVIQDRLAKGYLINPQVSVTITEFSKRRFTVLGQVQRPGSYEMLDQQEITLPQAIAMAGGYTRLADSKKVTVTHNDESGQQVNVLNARDMESGKDRAKFMVRPNDLVSVDESNF